MRPIRVIVGIVLLFVIGAVAGYWAVTQRTAPQPTGTITVYYTKPDGQTLERWPVTLGPARDRASVAFYAAVQAVAGPPSSIEAVRFPSGTQVNHVTLDAATAVVDLGGSVSGASGDSGSFAEAGEFKSLVWTLTDLPGISSVRVLVNGARVATLPGGHLELDEPLSRSSF